MEVAVFELNLPLESSTATEYDISRLIPRGHCCELFIYFYDYPVPVSKPIRLLGVVILLFFTLYEVVLVFVTIKAIVKII